jgi:predicted HD superfamily hydrolase involved in NAD metabolism
MDIDGYLVYLKGVISPSRLRHSIGVMQVMGELADVYSLDRDRAVAAALLHDAGKELSPTRQAELVVTAGIARQLPYDDDYVHYYHGPVGAALVPQELGITDDIILDAIAAHTYYGPTSNYDTSLSWCLRLSDLLEPGRDWSRVKWLRGIARLRAAAYGGRLAEAAFLQTGWLIQWFEADGTLIHPSMAQAYQQLAARLNLDRSFL